MQASAIKAFLLTNIQRLAAGTLRVGILKGSARSLPLSRRKRGFPAQAKSKKGKYPVRLRRGILLVTSLLLASCASNSIPKASSYNQAVGSWRGASGSSLVKVWGVPSSRTVSQSDGNRIYEYKKEDVKTVMGYTQPGQIVPAGMGGQVNNEYAPGYSTNMNTYAKFCTTRFEINKDDVIVATSSEGNFCKANQNDFRRLINPTAMNTETVATLEEKNRLR